MELPRYKRQLTTETVQQPLQSPRASSVSQEASAILGQVLTDTGEKFARVIDKALFANQYNAFVLDSKQKFSEIKYGEDPDTYKDTVDTAITEAKAKAVQIKHPGARQAAELWLAEEELDQREVAAKLASATLDRQNKQMISALEEYAVAKNDLESLEQARQTKIINGMPKEAADMEYEAKAAKIEDAIIVETAGTKLFEIFDTGMKAKRDPKEIKADGYKTIKEMYDTGGLTEAQRFTITNKWDNQVDGSIQQTAIEESAKAVKSYTDFTPMLLEGKLRHEHIENADIPNGTEKEPANGTKAKWKEILKGAWKTEPPKQTTPEGQKIIGEAVAGFSAQGMDKAEAYQALIDNRTLISSEDFKAAIKRIESPYPKHLGSSLLVTMSGVTESVKNEGPNAIFRQKDKKRAAWVNANLRDWVDSQWANKKEPTLEEMYVKSKELLAVYQNEKPVPEKKQVGANPDFPRSGVIRNPDGTVSTHKMSWGQDDKGFFVFPTIIEEWGNLRELPQKEAADYARKTGKIKRFSSQKEAEDYAAGSWKQQADLTTLSDAELLRRITGE